MGLWQQWSEGCKLCAVCTTCLFEYSSPSFLLQLLLMQEHTSKIRILKLDGVLQYSNQHPCKKVGEQLPFAMIVRGSVGQPFTLFQETHYAP